MASLEGAYQRIRYLMGDYPHRSTPSTITGKTVTNISGERVTLIYSYALQIGIYNHATKEYWTYAGRSTMTTNRHVKACKAAFTAKSPYGMGAR